MDPVNLFDSSKFHSQNQPEFEVGLTALSKFVSSNMRYPDAAKRKRTEGTVFVSFIIEINARVSEIFIAKGIDEECNAEAMRVFQIMPKWKPEKKDMK